MNVLRHWLVYSNGTPRVITSEDVVEHARQARPRKQIEGPFVLEAEQPQGAVEALERIHVIVQTPGDQENLLNRVFAHTSDWFRHHPGGGGSRGPL